MKVTRNVRSFAGLRAREDMKWEISSLWRDLMVVIFSGGKDIARYIQDNTMEERDWKACSMFLKSKGEGTTIWEGLFVWRIQVRHWNHIRKR